MPVEMGLTGLDYAIMAAYAVLTIGLGLAVSRHQRTAQDYFLAHRSMTWPYIGLALLASNISGTTLVGLAGAAYALGISVYNYEWMAAVILVFFCIFVLPFILKSGVYTMPEFLERRFDRRARLWFSGLTLFLNIVVDTAGTLYGGALLFKLIAPEVPLATIILVLALLAGIYTIAGGLAAVIYTETLQAVILLLGSVFIAWFAFDAAGGWTNVMTGINPAKLSLIRPMDDPGVPWTGLLLGVPLLGFYFWCTNQFMVQRVLSAKNLDHGRWGSLFAGFLKLPVLVLMVLPGTCAILLYPDLPNADQVYPTLVFDLLPAGLVGLVVAGFLAAVMSSVASTINSASTLVTMDFVRILKPGMSEAGLVRAGRLAALVFMAVSILWAPNIQNFGSLWQYLQAILFYAVPPIVALFTVGLFWRRANADGAFAALVGGFVVSAVLFVLNEVLDATDIHFLMVAPILFVVSTGILVVVSLATAPPPPERCAIGWSRAYLAEETAELRGVPAWKNYRVQSVALLALTAAIVWWFR